jgi:Fe2+ or Zn2+ uptake regulation protein
MDAEPRRSRRRTRQLALVLDAVRVSGVEHPCADRVFERVRHVLPRISLGTVYRNLQRLAAEGQIGVTHLDGRVARYDPTPAPHDHFVCGGCGRIEDLARDPAEERLGVAVPAGHVITSHALVLYGDCRDCRARVRE